MIINTDSKWKETLIYSIETENPESISEMKKHLEKHGEIIALILCPDGALFVVKETKFFKKEALGI